MSAVRGHRASPSATTGRGNVFSSSADMASLEPSTANNASSSSSTGQRGGSQPTSPGLSPKRKGSRASTGNSVEAADAIHVLESLDESSSGARSAAAAKRKTAAQAKEKAQTAQKAATAQQKRAGTGAIFNSEGADANIIRSGHEELNTLWASNDVKTGPITVNVCNAPNNSTVQCGCDNINCPFCNLMLSIEKTDPNVLQ